MAQLPAVAIIYRYATIGTLTKENTNEKFVNIQKHSHRHSGGIGVDHRLLCREAQSDGGTSCQASGDRPSSTSKEITHTFVRGSAHAHPHKHPLN